jgi:aspartyl/asparaginyl beta-hydroxylase (cupin superfamily)
MRKFARQAAKIALIAGLAYVFPKLVLLFVACGIYDVSRNRARTPELFAKYFFGNGVLTWLLSPVNTVLDLLSLPYFNKGVYNLEDLPPDHQAEIVKLIESTRRQDLVGQLQQAAAAANRSMFFFKWYGTYVDTVVRLPEFHDEYKYITTIGVSVFNKKQSTSKHFGPLRATLRVLYNIDDMVDHSAYIVVGDTTSYWRENKLFIFDDTLLHQSFNESDRPRYCLFVDIVRPTMMPGAFKAFVWAVGKMMSQGSNKVFYGHWKVFKNPIAR